MQLEAATTRQHRGRVYTHGHVILQRRSCIRPMATAPVVDVMARENNVDGQLHCTFTFILSVD